jgi:hypothetical protein
MNEYMSQDVAFTCIKETGFDCLEGCHVTAEKVLGRMTDMSHISEKPFLNKFCHALLQPLLVNRDYL